MTEHETSPETSELRPSTTSKLAGTATKFESGPRIGTSDLLCFCVLFVYVGVASQFKKMRELRVCFEEEHRPPICIGVCVVVCVPASLEEFHGRTLQRSFG